MIANKLEGNIVWMKQSLFENKANLYDGAPGFIPVFWMVRIDDLMMSAYVFLLSPLFLTNQAYRLFGDIKYYNASMDAAKFTAQKGILKTGMQMGVGTSGNAYMILWLASELSRERRAKLIKADWSMNEGINKPRYVWMFSSMIFRSLSAHQDAFRPSRRQLNRRTPWFRYWHFQPARLRQLDAQDRFEHGHTH